MKKLTLVPQLSIVICLGFLSTIGWASSDDEKVPNLTCVHDKNLFGFNDSQVFHFRNGELRITNPRETYVYGKVYPLPSSLDVKRFFSGHFTLVFYDNYQTLWAALASDTMPSEFTSRLNLYKCSHWEN